MALHCVYPPSLLPFQTPSNAERDAFELALVDATRKRDVPLLGICRGIQVLNVAFGGGLLQDVDDQFTTSLVHRQHEIGLTRDDTSHTVTMSDAPNPLSPLFGAQTLSVNSFHHQAVRDLAPGLRVIATAPDGLVEALFCPTMQFGVGVQWHPELLAQTHPHHLAIFAALVVAAIQHQTVRAL